MENTLYQYNKEALPQIVLDGHEDWIRLYDEAWQRAFDNVAYVKKAHWKPQLTCMPGAGIVWQWDSCFMSFITNYANGTISAMNNLDNLYRLRRVSDGYMSMAYVIDTEKPAYGERINPPLMAWAEWQYYLMNGDDSRFVDIFPALDGLFSFIENNRRRVNGLYWFEDSGSSGMDNAPRSGYMAQNLLGSDVCFIDLACQQVLSAQCISKIAGHLGYTEKANNYIEETQRIMALINNKHWSERKQFYFDLFARSDATKKDKFINIKTLASAWTILTGVAAGERLNYMVEHLFNPDEFYTPHPFASLSADDPNFDEKGSYWLGSVWAPTNYVVIRGLKEAGLTKLARTAAIKHLQYMADVNNDPSYGNIWECYVPYSKAPAITENGKIVASNFVGWSGLGPITMLIENILGFSFDASQNTVCMNVTQTCKHGIKNLKFNGGKISIICEAPANNGTRQIQVTTEKPFILNLVTDDNAASVTFAAQTGENRFLT